MPKPLKQQKLSDIILSQLETMIIEGSLEPGEKLLPERELALQFEVSRPSLREAIQKLEAKGLVTRKQGGGTFVSKAIMKSFADPLFDLMANSNESQFDLLEFRHGMEGMASYYAAMRGTKADFDQIQAKHDHIGNCQLEDDYRLEAKAVYEFYVAICAASHNTLILHTARSMSALLIDNIEQNYNKTNETITPSYLPNDNASYFNGNDNLVDWLRSYSEEKDEVFIRGFL